MGFKYSTKKKTLFRWVGNLSFHRNVYIFSRWILNFLNFVIKFSEPYRENRVCVCMCVWRIWDCIRFTFIGNDIDSFACACACVNNMLAYSTHTHSHCHPIEDTQTHTHVHLHASNQLYRPTAFERYKPYVNWNLAYQAIGRCFENSTKLSTHEYRGSTV